MPIAGDQRPEFATMAVMRQVVRPDACVFATGERRASAALSGR